MVPMSCLGKADCEHQYLAALHVGGPPGCMPLQRHLCRKGASVAAGHTSTACKAGGQVS